MLEALLTTEISHPVHTGHKDIIPNTFPIKGSQKLHFSFCVRTIQRSVRSEVMFNFSKLLFEDQFMFALVSRNCKSAKKHSENAKREFQSKETFKDTNFICLTEASESLRIIMAAYSELTVCIWFLIGVVIKDQQAEVQLLIMMPRGC